MDQWLLMAQSGKQSLLTALTHLSAASMALQGCVFVASGVFILTVIVQKHLKKSAMIWQPKQQRVIGGGVLSFHQTHFSTWCILIWCLHGSVHLNHSKQGLWQRKLKLQWNAVSLPLSSLCLPRHKHPVQSFQGVAFSMRLSSESQSSSLPP